VSSGNVNSIHNKWDLTFHIETNFGALSSVLDILAEQIRQHGDTLTKFAERKEMNGNT
jgi:ACT domain-containing protein